ncbi:toxin RTX-I translocation ATP-binding protein [mine drainage metagenome]|uniref:Toxin RTX-I translocation ATP-binding protein n=1 Tax=mine drainage metagenome TaxID=410659 RepID=A0A1J5RKH7_9ZZZZ
MTPDSAAAELSLPRETMLPDDALTSCLVILTRLFHHPFSAQALTAGLPLENSRLTPELFPRAAARAGLSSRVVKRSLRQISPLTLPALLLLSDGRACVVTGRSDESNWTVIQPESGAGEVSIATEALEKEYAGYAIFSRPAFKFDARAHDEAIPRVHHWFWGVMQRAWPLYSEVFIASFLINVFALVTPLFAMNVYDRVVPNQAFETLWVLSIGVILIALFDFVMKSLRGYFLDVAGKQVDTVLSATIFEKVLGLKAVARPPSVGGLANTLHEFDSFRDFITSATTTTLIDLPFVLLFLIIVFWLGGWMVLVPLFAIPLIIFTSLALQRPLEKHLGQSMRVGSQKQALLIEALGGIETIKAMGAESPIQRKWEQMLGESGRVGITSKLLSSTIMNLTALIQQLAYVCAIIFGVHLIADRLLTVGGLIASTILIGRILAPFAQIAGLITRYYQTLQALRGVDNIMNLAVERPAQQNFVQRSFFKGDIDFRNLSFAYPGQDVPALNNVSFKITQGERVGIIGRIGSGKTTIEKLLLGLYEPSEGSIWIDGIDLKQLDPADLRRNIGYVPQDVTLFFGTVKDNIVLGAPYVDDAAMLKAAEISGVSEFVHRHPKGFDMSIGERGEGISGGQRQSISIARALLLDPPILMMDEPSNSLDNRSEEAFKARLSSHLQGRTLIIVTHRASLLTLVDRLIVMDNGRVIADGPKEQVLAALSGGRVNAAA